MNQNDVYSELEAARKEMEEILKLLPSQERLDRVAKAIQQKEVDLDTLPYSVANAIQQAEDAHKKLERYILILTN